MCYNTKHEHFAFCVAVCCGVGFRLSDFPRGKSLKLSPTAPSCFAAAADGCLFSFGLPRRRVQTIVLSLFRFLPWYGNLWLNQGP